MDRFMLGNLFPIKIKQMVHKIYAQGHKMNPFGHLKANMHPPSYLSKRSSTEG